MPPQDKSVSGPAGHAVLAADNTYDRDRKDPFWFRGNIDAARWNRSYPFQLLVVKQKVENGSATYYRDSVAKKWTFTLPFTPESLKETWPFAVEGGATQGGYVEQRNGSPVRPLSFSGTLGVLPLRGSSPQLAPANFAQAAFAGTIANINRAASAAKTAVAQFQGPGVQGNLVPSSDFDGFTAVSKTSGYYQLQLLQRFFESWQAFSRTKQGRDYFLAVALWKRREVYVVRPLVFEAVQVGNLPLEHRYSFEAQAWRSINLDGGPPSVPGLRPGLRDSNAMAKCLSALQETRQALEDVRDALTATVADVDRTLFEPLREAALFMIDALSLPPAFADLPKTIASLCQNAVLDFVGAQTRQGGLAPLLRGLSAAARDDLQLLAQASVQGSQQPAGSPGDRPQRGVPALPGQSGPNASPAYDPFRNPELHYDLLSSLQPSTMKVPPAAQSAIDSELARVRSFTRSDFEQRRASAASVGDAFASLAGMGDSTYDALHGRSSPPASRQPTAADHDTAYALNRAALELSRLAVAAPGTSPAGPTLGFLQALHQRSGIPFDLPASKFLATLPAGETLERLALRYLGDPDRVGEIVAVNGLRAPYLDEEGFSLPLLAPGSGNEVVVGSSANLEAGQAVWVSSTVAPTSMRRIVAVAEPTPGFATVTVDGDPTMGSYSPLAGAALRAHLPGTVSSQSPIWIPSADAPGIDDYGTAGSGVLDRADLLAAAGGVDFLTTSRGDMVVTKDGDRPLATGFVNDVQQARILLSLTQGALLRHPQLGLAVPAGTSVADMDAKQLLQAAQSLFDGDPAFTGVMAAAVQLKAPVLQLGLQVGVRGLPKLVPISVDVELP